MLEKIDHLGLAVAKMDQAGAVYEALGIPRDGVEEVAEQKVKVAFYQVGESRIELLEPTTLSTCGLSTRSAAARGASARDCSLSASSMPARHCSTIAGPRPTALPTPLSPARH